MTKTFPIQLNLAGRRVVVVGGGEVAARKVASLVEVEADVLVVSPSFVPALLNRDDIRREAREYHLSVLEGVQLVFACTDDGDLNAKIAADAAAAGVLCNAVDNLEASDFFMPAVLRRGDFTIAVGTGGASPQLAAVVRDRLESKFGDNFAIVVEELARVRPVVQQRVAEPAVRRKIFETLCGDSSIKLLAEKDRQAWRRWCERVVQNGSEGIEEVPEIE